ncbi:MAG: tRNA lysidine(34) synthetase TilS [Desulfuromonadales bacterium]
MRDTLIKTISDQNLIQPGDRVLVAVSGGRDSVVLLHLLLDSAAALSVHLCVAHLDHGMRAEGRGDASFVRRLCEKWGVPCFEGRVDVRALAQTRRKGLEETAREERRRFLRQVARAESCQVIALGHHRGDQVETFLQRLLRGTGSSGLAAMRPRSDVFVRPLLHFSPERIEAYSRRHQLEHVEDASNLDMRFTRNRIRHRVLPVLRELQPALDSSVARLCDQLSAEADFWRECEERALEDLSSRDGDYLRLDCSGLLSLHRALRPRVIRRALCRLRGDVHGIDAAHIAHIERLLENGPPQGEVDLSRAWAGRRYDYLLLGEHPPPEPQDYSVTIEGTGTWQLPCGGLVIVSRQEKALRTDDPRMAEFSSALLFPLQIRNFRPGDRIALPRVAGFKKIKNLFIDAKIEKELRQALPLLARDSEVLWAAGLRRSCRFMPDSDTEKVLRIEFSSCPVLDKWLVDSRGLC